MRQLCLLALVFSVAAAEAQPVPGDPDEEVSRVRAVRSHTLSVEAGGMSAFIGGRYERVLSRQLRASVGYSQFTTGEIFATRNHNVPVSVSAVYPVSARWLVDGGVGALLLLSVDEVGTFSPAGTTLVIESTGDVALRAMPALNVGARFEGQLLYARLGASLLARPPDVASGRVGWDVFPWPSLGAGVRF